MSQTVGPDADVNNDGAWTTEPLFNKVDEASADDGDYIVSAKSASGTVCKLGFPNTVTDPTYHTGHKLRIRAKSTGTGTIKFELMQGTTVIHDSGNQTLDTAFGEFNFTCTEAEAANITNYANLSIRITAVATGTNKYQWVSWVRLEITDPSTWTPKAILIT